MSARHFLENHWPSITIAVTATAIACAFLVMLRSMPPHLIVMATGREGDAYYEIGERYEKLFIRNGQSLNWDCLNARRNIL
jgi:TRAP-type uncharacterized transport system substrate-binding protein